MTIREPVMPVCTGVEVLMPNGDVERYWPGQRCLGGIVKEIVLVSSRERVDVIYTNGAYDVFPWHRVLRMQFVPRAET